MSTGQKSAQSTGDELSTDNSMSSPHEAVLLRSGSKDDILIKGQGDWVISTIAQIDVLFTEFEGEAENGKKLTIDLAEIGLLDTSGAWLIDRLAVKWTQAGGELKIKNPSIRSRTLLEAVNVGIQKEPPQPPKTSWHNRFLYTVGEAVYGVKRDTAMGLNIIGSAIQGPQLKENRGGGIRFISIVHNLDKMGLGAVPIIILMSFFIGAIVAQQAAFQLRFVGLEAIASDWVGAMLLREICVLLTAIMIAGRSGSAMTAEIGSMKMREEVDALKVIGLNPIGVLVFPRLVALTIAMPLLTFISNIAALAGAALLLRFYSDVPLEDFVTRLRAFIDLETVFAGLIKAPFMGLIIGVMAAVEGLKVGGSTDSLGQHTTAAVVKAIFFVIVVDGLFAIFYAAIDY